MFRFRKHEEGLILHEEFNDSNFESELNVQVAHPHLTSRFLK